MKKTVLSIAVLLATTFAGFSVSAQTPDTQNCTSKTECSKGGTKDKAPKYNPFEGLNLSEKQQAELKALRPDKATMDKAKAEAKAEKQAQKKQRFEQRIQSRKDYLAKVKNILTPEQYVQFLENSYVDQGMMKAPRDGKMAKNKKNDGKRHEMRGNRFDRAQN